MTATSPFALTSTNPPWVVLAPPGDELVADQVAEVERRGAVFRLDESELADARSLFAEFARKLPLPEYVTHDWDSLLMCLGDLHQHWHGERMASVVIDPADDLVYRPFFGLLLDVLCQGAEQANRSLDGDGGLRTEKPFPLHFVLALSPTGMYAALQRVRERDDVVISEAGEYVLLTAAEDLPPFHTWFADRAERVGQRRTGFGESLWAWSAFVERCAEGYDGGLDEFVADRSVRRRLELALSPEADGIDLVRLAREDLRGLDDAYRAVLLPDVVVESGSPHWWERGIPRRGGQRFVQEVRDRYGVQVETQRTGDP